MNISKQRKMDYFNNDKVELLNRYTKHIMAGHGWTDHGLKTVCNVARKDIEHHMLHFLENHERNSVLQSP